MYQLLVQYNLLHIRVVLVSFVFALKNMSKETVNIKELNKLLGPAIGPDFDIADVHVSRLTAAGENYGSIMLRVDIKLKNGENGKEENIYGVAKLIPPYETVQKIFNTQVTFKNEVAFYDTIVPTLLEFQKEQGMDDVIDCFGKFLGARINLNGSDVVDEDAVLMLENLKVAGYSNIDRHKGFELESAKLILRDLAMLHAVPLALKLKKPEVFKKNVLPYCHRYVPKQDHAEEFTEIVKSILSENEYCKPLLHKIKPWGAKESCREPREPFSTLVHNDLWVNNSMQKFENGKPVSNKLVDFQIFCHGSPAADVFFFLFSSVQMSVLKEHLNSLLRYYHEHFTKVLEKLKCNIEPFNFDKFLEEMRTEAYYEFTHAIVFSTMIVNANKHSHEFDGSAVNKDHSLRLINQDNKERAQYITLECEKLGWLY